MFEAFSEGWGAQNLALWSMRYAHDRLGSNTCENYRESQNRIEGFRLLRNEAVLISEDNY